MVMSRRAFIGTAGLVVSGARMALAQGTALTVLQVPELMLSQNTDTLVGADVSRQTLCEIEILNSDRQTIKGFKWLLEPRKPQGQFVPADELREKNNAASTHGVRITMNAGRVAPSIAVALIQSGSLAGRAGRGRGDGAIVAGKSDAGRMARRARFIDDPAARPGQFGVALPADGSVRLRIWKGEDASGTPIHEERFNKVPQGEQRIPWDLRARGTRVQAGRYTALLVCTPDDSPLRPTNLISYFAVA